MILGVSNNAKLVAFAVKKRSVFLLTVADKRKIHAILRNSIFGSDNLLNPTMQYYLMRTSSSKDLLGCLLFLSFLIFQ